MKLDEKRQQALHLAEVRRFIEFTKKRLLEQDKTLNRMALDRIDNCIHLYRKDHPEMVTEWDDLSRQVLHAKKKMENTAASAALSSNEEVIRIAEVHSNHIPTPSVNPEGNNTIGNHDRGGIRRRQTPGSSLPSSTSISAETDSGERLQALLLQQKDISAQEMDDELRQQSRMMQELSEMTTVLKEATLHMHHTVHQQNLQLDSIQVHASDNMNELNSQRNKMNKTVTTATTSVFSSLVTLVWVVALFVITFVVIRIFPKP